MQKKKFWRTAPQSDGKLQQDEKLQLTKQPTTAQRPHSKGSVFLERSARWLRIRPGEHSPHLKQETEGGHDPGDAPTYSAPSFCPASPPTDNAVLDGKPSRAQLAEVADAPYAAQADISSDGEQRMCGSSSLPEAPPTPQLVSELMCTWCRRMSLQHVKHLYRSVYALIIIAACTTHVPKHLLVFVHLVFVHACFCACLSVDYWMADHLVAPWYDYCRKSRSGDCSND